MYCTKPQNAIHKRFDMDSNDEPTSSQIFQLVYQIRGDDISRKDNKQNMKRSCTESRITTTASSIHPNHSSENLLLLRKYKSKSKLSVFSTCRFLTVKPTPSQQTKTNIFIIYPSFCISSSFFIPIRIRKLDKVLSNPHFIITS